MAFITKSGDIPCYSCGKQCINVEFCSNGADYSDGVSLSRNIRVKIVANSGFWGFGGVLISGYATYSNGFYDFFDGYDEDHTATKECKISATETIITGPFRNEQRPDVFYRSVYDPDTGDSTHYSNGFSYESSGDSGRGGAEVYLINRPKGLVFNVTQDKKSCDETNVYEIFRKFPENFGWGNKINFNTSIYKNLTGAWRLTSIENCYSNPLRQYKPPGYLIDCSGEERMNISSNENKFQNYEKTRLRGSGFYDGEYSHYYDFSNDCRPDGSVASKYRGKFNSQYSIYRDISESEFIQARLSYGADGMIGASGLKNGMQIGLKNDVSGIFNNVYYIFDVDNLTSPNYTSVKFVGTSTGNTPLEIQTASGWQALPTGDFRLDIPFESGHWVAFGTHDPQTCCGLAAYGVSDIDKQICGNTNYHTDFRRVFNNPKNLRQSNRDTEWRETYGLYSSIKSLSGSGVHSGIMDFMYPSVTGVEESGTIRGYPIIVSGNSYLVATGDAYISGYPLMEREKSYYGDFSEVDRCNTRSRLEQISNRGIGSNGTCYSKHATLEIFPDCITQYDKYEVCDEGYDEYMVNRLPRLAFVYRGCDFDDDCSFDDDGRPLGGWKDNEGLPQNIEELKKQLAGQEIHMFINLAEAWGGRIPPTPCPCDGDTGEDPPRHVKVPTPLRFPAFPNFDLNPQKYGCLDPRYQTQTINRFIYNGTLTDTDYCDPWHNSSHVCRARQPYTTYGYIMNLCGKESRNRKDVITKAFAKLHQEKTYTHLSHTGEIDEPMYWEIEAPNPAPYFGGGIWGSGTTDRDDTGGVGYGFLQIAGSGYGYWGVADSNNNVVAPYFATERGQYKCPDDTAYRYYVDYSTTGTFLNLLNTENGWPTDKVPFLIELEVDDACVGGCATPNMKNENLVLEIEGLSGEFIWDQKNKYYGHNYCSYRDTGNINDFRAKLTSSFGCNGTNLHLCSEDDEEVQTYAHYYNSGLCGCINKQNEIILNPVTISGTDIVIGWRNGRADGQSLIHLSGCSDYSSNYLDVNYSTVANGQGYTIFANFELACPSMMNYLPDPEYPFAAYEGNPVDTLWGSNFGCSHRYPAVVGQDLDLKTTQFMVVNRLKGILTRFSQRALRQANLTTCILPEHIWGGENVGWFGACPGDTVTTYGCWLGTRFYGCGDGGGGSTWTASECEGKTMCNTCPTGNGSEEVICRCGTPIGYDGIVPQQPPMNYALNECFCLCSSPTPIATYTIGEYNNSLILTSGDHADCASVYWMSVNGTGPILMSCGPPTPYLGINLGTQQSIDWFDWSHGVNGIAKNVKYELKKPYKSSEANCEQLVKYGDDIIDCSYTGCFANTGVDQKTCGNPIFASGGIFNDPDDVKVRKKKCSPEIALVTKIDCIKNYGYRLKISREYHEHDRTWKESITIGEGQEATDICVPVNVGAFSGTWGCSQLPYSVLADSVTPLYNAPCSIHPSSGVYVNQDYRYEQDMAANNVHHWNYFNLFYSLNYLPTIPSGTLYPSIGRDDEGNFDCALSPLTIQNTGTIFSQEKYLQPPNTYGIFATNYNHSCVQDAEMCGGDMWCNKMFFPRHAYAPATKVAPFGASSLCTMKGQFLRQPGYGYDENSEIIPSAKEILEEQLLSFYDWCDEETTVPLLQSVEIDDDEIYVPDYLPLMGVIHPGWRFTSDVKSCTFGGSGCADNIPIHTEETILAGAHIPKNYISHGFDSMGYYLDRYGVSSGSPVATDYIRATGYPVSGHHGCLLSPFKILIDVECSTNRIARKEFPIDPPTFLQGVQEWPSSSCLGHIGIPTCDCGNTKCAMASTERPGACTAFKIASYAGSVVEGTFLYCEDGYTCNGCTPTGCQEVTGKFIKRGASVTEYYHPNVLEEDSEIMGIIADPSGVCVAQGCPGGNYFEYAIPLDPSEMWVKQKCNGEYRSISPSTESVVRLWQCDSNQYLNPHPGNGPISQPDPYCYCEHQLNGLCTATTVCTDFSTCECNPIPYTAPGSSFWFNDCHCQKNPAVDIPCTATAGGTKSLIKWTITEAG